MPYPFQYAAATRTFHDVLEEVRVQTGLVTTNQAYTVLQGVLHAFRRRVGVQESLWFADLLPVGVRALYVHEWDIDEDRRPFGDPLELAAEVRALRSPHNWAPETCVPDVARALRRFVDEQALDDLLRRLPTGAATFWAAHPRSRRPTPRGTPGPLPP